MKRRTQKNCGQVVSRANVLIQVEYWPDELIRIALNRFALLTSEDTYLSLSLGRERENEERGRERESEWGKTRRIKQKKRRKTRDHLSFGWISIKYMANFWLWFKLFCFGWLPNDKILYGKQPQIKWESKIIHWIRQKLNGSARLFGITWDDIPSRNESIVRWKTNKDVLFSFSAIFSLQKENSRF